METVKNENSILAKLARMNNANVIALIALFLVNKFYTKFNEQTDEIKFDIYRGKDENGKAIKLQFKIIGGKTLSFRTYSILISKIDISKLRADHFEEDLMSLFDKQIQKDQKAAEISAKLDHVDPAVLDKFLKDNKKN